MTPEFSRPERIDTIGDGREVTLVADERERAALARRFGLLAVARLEARFRLGREGASVLATGQVEAVVTQACSVSGEPIAARVDEPVRLRFVEDGAADEELELSEGDLDTLLIEAGAIDLGEAAAETMALALDPFPRAEGAEEALRAAGVVSEDEAELGPFSGLAALKNRLG